MGVVFFHGFEEVGQAQPVSEFLLKHCVPWASFVVRGALKYCSIVSFESCCFACGALEAACMPEGFCVCAYNYVCV